MVQNLQEAERDRLHLVSPANTIRRDKKETRARHHSMKLPYSFSACLANTAFFRRELHGGLSIGVSLCWRWG